MSDKGSTDKIYQMTIYWIIQVGISPNPEHFLRQARC